MTFWEKVTGNDMTKEFKSSEETALSKLYDGLSKATLFDAE